MNTIVDALSGIREVNMLSCTKLISYLYNDHLRGKYPNDNYFVKYYDMVPGEHLWRRMEELKYHVNICLQFPKDMQMLYIVCI